MRKSATAALFAILLAAVLLRLLPLLRFVTWGSDVGEYFLILRRLGTTGYVSTDYVGWGITYAYFPGMFFVQAGLVDLGGVDVPAVLDLLVPILAGLAVLPLFLLGATITRESKVGLFLAAFVSLSMPHAFATSHTAPSSLGDLLVLSALLLFLRLRGDRKALVPLLLVTASLIVTHHLSLYFLIVMVVLSLFLHGLLSSRVPWPGLRRDLAFVAALLLGTFAFWFGYARTFSEGILHDVDVRPWWLLLAAFPVLLGAMAGIVLLRQRSSRRFRPRVPAFRRSAAMYAAALGAVVAVIVWGILVTIPGSSITLPPTVLPFFAPLYILMAFSAAGRRPADFLRRGADPSAWLLALLLSIVFGALFAPRTIIPYRHVEYIVVPLGLFAGIGFFHLLRLAGLRPGLRTAAVAACGILLGANALSAFPPPDVLVGWQEGGRPAAFDAAYWSREHVTGLLLADHRASSLAFGFGGVNATWDRTLSPLPAATFAEARPGMLAVPSPSGTKDVTYVWLDADTEQGVALYPWDPASPMSATAIAKFSESPFVKVFDNGYARVYWVAWGCDGSC